MIRKAVIPAAGFGTRFLPATKSQPKEMLPIVDTPVIQYVVEEAVSAGITDILMVIGKGKRSIEEHFDRSFQLESQLLAKGKETELKAMRRISELADIHFVWQKELNGLGDAVYCARHHVNDEPFVVLLGDTIMEAAKPPVRQLLEVFERYQEPVVLLEKVQRERVNRYGVIDGKEIEPGLYLVEDFVEKPDIDEAPSNLAIASRYVLTPEIFEYLSRFHAGCGGGCYDCQAVHNIMLTGQCDCSFAEQIRTVINIEAIAAIDEVYIVGGEITVPVQPKRQAINLRI